MFSGLHSRCPNGALHTSPGCNPGIRTFQFFGVLKERCIPRNGLGPHWRYAAFLQNAPILQLSIPRVPPWAGMRSPVGAGDDRLDLPFESNGPRVHGPPPTVHRPPSTVHVSWFMVHGSWFMVHGSWFMVHESMRSMNVLWLAFRATPKGQRVVLRTDDMLPFPWESKGCAESCGSEDGSEDGAERWPRATVWKG